MGACASRVLKEAAGKPETLLGLADSMLGSLADAGAPTLLASPAAFAALRNVTSLVISQYQRLTGGELGAKTSSS